MSLRYQISVRILIIAFCILLLGGSISIWQARMAVNEEVDSSINLALQLIKIGIGTNKSQKTDWLFRLNSLKQTRHLTIQLKKPSGEIINISNHSQFVDNNKTPPDWFINLVVSQYPTKVEHQIDTFSDNDLTLIIQANPIDEIAEVWDESLAFFGTLLLLVALTFLSVHLVFNKALLSIQSIVDHLKNIEKGEYQHKLAGFSTQEYDDIATAINHMTYVLDSTQQQNKALTQHSLKIQEEERQYLSQELHDEFGQSLTAIKAMAVSAVHEKSDIQKISTSIIDICDHLMTVVRSMMKQLHPLTLTELGLKATLEEMIHHWNERNNVTSFNLHCDAAIEAIDQTILIQIYRIIQEALTNIIRHAQAEQVKISLDLNTTPKSLMLVIIDNGQGFNLNQVESGFGLLGMEERTQLLGGEFKLQSKTGEGTQIIIYLPLL